MKTPSEANQVNKAVDLYQLLAEMAQQPNLISIFYNINKGFTSHYRAAKRTESQPPATKPPRKLPELEQADRFMEQTISKLPEPIQRCFHFQYNNISQRMEIPVTDENLFNYRFGFSQTTLQEIKNHRPAHSPIDPSLAQSLSSTYQTAMNNLPQTRDSLVKDLTEVTKPFGFQPTYQPKLKVITLEATT